MSGDLHDIITLFLHDLRSNLGAILLNAALITPQEDGGDGRTILRSKEEIFEQAQFIVELINKIDRIVTLQSKKYEKQLASFNLVEYTSQIVSELDATVERKIRFDPAVGELIIITDPLRYREALLALLENVVTFSQADTVIEVRLSNRESGGAYLTIFDQYSGIPEDQQERIFEPFNRIQTAPYSLDRGTGLGPYLARWIIEGILDGSVSYSSNTKTGTKFEINLPAGNTDCDVSKLALISHNYQLRI
jgi:signal transduction histidine kinase